MKNKVYKKVDDYLKHLEINSGQSSIHSIVDLHSTISQNAIELMKEHKLIGFRSGTIFSLVDLTIKGQECIDAGGIEEYLKTIEINQSSNIHIGNKITGNVYKSDLSTSALNFSSTTPTSIQNKQSIVVVILKWILKNIVQIIITVIAAAIAYYLGFTKSQ